MIQSFRDRLQGIFAVGLVVLISIPFVLFGVESLFAPSNTGGQVAEVNGEKITELELNRAVQLRRQQIIGRLGDQVPEQLISAEALRQPVLDQLILQKAEVQEGKSSRLAVDKATLDKILTEQVAFQQDGQFSPQLYRSMLAQLNYTPSSYKQVLTDELIGDQLRAGIGLSSFSTEGEVVDTLLRAGQTRDFYYVTLGRDSFSEGAAPTAEQVQAHYDAKQAQYMGPEKVKVEYINLDAKALASADDVSEDEALAQYQQDIKVFEGTERRRIAHILVEDLGDGADADKVSSIAQRLGAGDDFAAVAKELSEDIATADSGGDLGFSSGDSFPAAVEEAIKTMSVGAVSEAVVSEYGTHFVKLLELDKPEPPSFAESKAEIVNKLVDQKGLQRFDELVLELEELAYNADDLSVVAEPLGLTLQSSDWLARGQAQGVLANSKVMAAIFSDEVLKERASSEPIELGDAQQVVVRVTDYQAPAVKPLAEVEPQIVASLTAKTIVERQQQAAAKLQQAAEQGASLEDLAKVDSYPWEVVIQSRRDNFQVDRQLLESVFSQRSKTLPAMNTVALANGDLVLVQLNKISELDPASIAAGEKAPVAKQLEQQQAMAQYGAFQAQLKAEMDSQVF